MPKKDVVESTWGWLPFPGLRDRILMACMGYGALEESLGENHPDTREALDELADLAKHWFQQNDPQQLDENGDPVPREEDGSAIKHLNRLKMRRAVEKAKAQNS